MEKHGQGRTDAIIIWHAASLPYLAPVEIWNIAQIVTSVVQILYRKSDLTLHPCQWSNQMWSVWCKLRIKGRFHIALSPQGQGYTLDSIALYTWRLETFTCFMNFIKKLLFFMCKKGWPHIKQARKDRRCDSYLQSETINDSLSHWLTGVGVRRSVPNGYPGRTRPDTRYFFQFWKSSGSG